MMNKSLRSSQEDPPNWLELEKNSLSQLKRIISELSVVPPKNVTREILISMIQHRLHPVKSKNKNNGIIQREVNDVNDKGINLHDHIEGLEEEEEEVNEEGINLHDHIERLREEEGSDISNDDIQLPHSFDDKSLNLDISESNGFLKDDDNLTINNESNQTTYISDGIILQEEVSQPHKYSTCNESFSYFSNTPPSKSPVFKEPVSNHSSSSKTKIVNNKKSNSIGFFNEFKFGIMVFLIGIYLSHFLFMEEIEETYCPKNAICKNNKIICKNGFVLITNHCFPKENISLYYNTLTASRYISLNDGKCIGKKSFIKSEVIMKKFPKASIPLMLSNKEFNIYQSKEFLRSSKPKKLNYCSLASSSLPNIIRLLLIITILILIIHFINYFL